MISDYEVGFILIVIVVLPAIIATFYSLRTDKIANEKSAQPGYWEYQKELLKYRNATNTRKEVTSVSYTQDNSPI